MSPRPTLYLDIDGVLNAIPDEPAPPGYSMQVIDGYVIHLHDEITDMVAELARHYDIVWFTLWNQRAAPLIGPHVGLESAPHLHTSWQLGKQTMLTRGYSEAALNFVLYAKTPLLKDRVDLDARWIWIDDSHGRGDHSYLTRQGFDPANFRLLRTDSRVGLTWADVERAVAWLPELGQVTAEMELGAVERNQPGTTAGRTEAV